VGRTRRERRPTAILSRVAVSTSRLLGGLIKRTRDR
jgi:hypothetical protein